MKLIAEPMELRPELPVVVGNVDYLEFERRLRRMDELLRLSGLEAQWIERRLGEWMGRRKRTPGARAQRRFQSQCRLALRCTLARQWTEKEYRRFSRRLAESALLQWFCQLGRMEVVKVPTKSTLQRYEALATEGEIRELVGQLNRLAGRAPEVGRQPLGLKEPADMDMVWADSACLKANIHFPVDWVLLRDAMRTLMKAATLIRGQGLRHRMEEPAVFIKRMNRLSMEMTQAGRRSGSIRARKRILRGMKRLSGTMRRHAKRYRAILAERWGETQWTQRQAAQVLRRMDGVLSALPGAIRQAHERIIGGRQVPNEQKVLSLYEPDLRVIVRGKAGAEVEFGNTMYVAEQEQGLIVDWALEREQSPGDPTLLERSLERFKEVFGEYPAGVAADRGFDRKHTRRSLAARGIYCAVCARSIRELREQLKDEVFVEMHRRRAQTEARIGILQNDFLGAPLLNKGFESRQRAVAWAVLAHNLWVLARLPQASARSGRKKKAA